MRNRKITNLFLTKSLSLAAILAFSGISIAGNLSPLVDDFSDPNNNSLGIQRQFMSDRVAGGKTTIEQAVLNGVISLKGEITPPRGQPGWASTVLLLDAKNLPQDASGFDGVQLLIKINKGNLTISANSSEVTNFDYHAAPIVVIADGKFHQVKIPFTSMKRAWSEQTLLNSGTISSLSLAAYDLQKGSFDFEVDQVSFY